LTALKQGATVAAGNVFGKEAGITTIREV